MHRCLICSTLVYAIVLQNKPYKRILAAHYRISSIKIISHFRTTSDEAPFHLVGLISVDIIVLEMKRIHLRLAKRSQDDGDSYIDTGESD